MIMITTILVKGGWVSEAHRTRVSNVAKRENDVEYDRHRCDHYDHYDRNYPSFGRCAPRESLRNVRANGRKHASTRFAYAERLFTCTTNRYVYVRISTTIRREYYCVPPFSPTSCDNINGCTESVESSTRGGRDVKYTVG
uniref:Uncharacterized protein n=1 Tax=Sipha flava TaxID=143950 RepID=A0A2S2QSY7_9HEMI